MRVKLSEINEQTAEKFPFIMPDTTAKDFESDLIASIKLEAKKGNNYIPSTKYKPSSLQCIRNMYFYMTSTPLDDLDMPYFMQGISQSGTDIHVRIQDAVQKMKENGFDCEYVDVKEFVTERNLDYLDIIGDKGNETKLYDKRYNMIFLCDGIIKYKGEYYIIEFKTKGTKKWQALSAVENEHKDQATAYSLALGLGKVLFVYINRDYLAFKTFMFNVDTGMRNNLAKKIQDCDNYVQSNIVPPKPEKVDCSNCPYQSHCKEI